MSSISDNADRRDRRLLQLEEVRALAIECDYDGALKGIEEFLSNFPNDFEGLRLKGNVLEQKALDLNEFRAAKLTRSTEYLAARECYELLLRLDPKNTTSLIDLGDHFKNLDAYDKAFDYYDRAFDLIQVGESRLGKVEELKELINTCSDLSRHNQTSERAIRLKKNVSSCWPIEVVGIDAKTL